MKRVKSEEYGLAGYWICEDGNIVQRADGTIIPVYSSGVVRLAKVSTGKKINVTAHRLIAQVFVENPNRHSFVKFKDGNPRNRAANNLEWVNAVKKLSPQTLEFVQAWKDGLSTVEIAYMYDVTPQYVNRVLRDEQKRRER